MSNTDKDKGPEPQQTAIVSSHGVWVVDRFGMPVDHETVPACYRGFRVLADPFGIYHGETDVLMCWLVTPSGVFVPPDMEHYRHVNKEPSYP